MLNRPAAVSDCCLLGWLPEKNDGVPNISPTQACSENIIRKDILTIKAL
jgi:hypothetical protein